MGTWGSRENGWWFCQIRFYASIIFVNFRKSRTNYECSVDGWWFWWHQMLLVFRKISTFLEVPMYSKLKYQIISPISYELSVFILKQIGKIYHHTIFIKLKTALNINITTYRYFRSAHYFWTISGYFEAPKWVLAHYFRAISGYFEASKWVLAHYIWVISRYFEAS